LKNGDLSIVFPVQRKGGSQTGSDPENGVGDQDIGSQFFTGCKCPVSRGIVVQEQDPVVDLPAVGVFPSKCPSVAPAEMSNTPR